jgi:hypothetical protein
MFDRLARTEVLELEEGTDLALALCAQAQRGVNLYEALGPLDRLGLRRELEDRIAGDQLLRFREVSVGHHALASGEPDTRALRARLQPAAFEPGAGLDQVLGPLGHLRQELLVRPNARFEVLGGFERTRISPPAVSR